MASNPDGVRLPAAWNYGAVERALRDARDRGDRSIFEPTVGKVFDSPQEGYEFYNMYSWEVGFGIRYGRSRKSSTDRRTRQDIVCACEVLVHYGYKELPPGLILRRWTRDAKNHGDAEAAVSLANQVSNEIDTSAMHTLAYSAAMELVGLTATSRQAFEIGLDFVSRAKQAISSMTVVVGEEVPAPFPSEADNSAGTVAEPARGDLSEFGSVTAPPRVRSRGRPVHTRFKSPIESPGASKRKRAPPADIAAKSPRKSARIGLKQVGNKKNGGPLCRICKCNGHCASKCPQNNVDAEKAKGSRVCKSCGETGHYRTTCGRKSTYSAAYCGEFAGIWRSNTVRNPGRVFYRCSCLRCDCGYFAWRDRRPRLNFSNPGIHSGSVASSSSDRRPMNCTFPPVRIAENGGHDDVVLRIREVDRKVSYVMFVVFAVFLVLVWVALRG
ncbi:hypothetical protein EJB05_38168 [Eragrostis curvula]|uniref:CCHC-type domain-containing protein n=1 Tax=Eragrostis curvula TaxID=38414 RepID=A0A5J9TTK6_9POAL|nr:hypothetical protein EJB05_38168 [Eragrostis curvula]